MNPEKSSVIAVKKVLKKSTDLKRAGMNKPTSQDTRAQSKLVTTMKKESVKATVSDKLKRFKIPKKSSLSASPNPKKELNNLLELGEVPPQILQSGETAEQLDITKTPSTDADCSKSTTENDIFVENIGRDILSEHNTSVKAEPEFKETKPAENNSTNNVFPLEPQNMVVVEAGEMLPTNTNSIPRETPCVREIKTEVVENAWLSHESPLRATKIRLTRSQSVNESENNLFALSSSGHPESQPLSMKRISRRLSKNDIKDIPPQKRQRRSTPKQTSKIADEKAKVDNVRGRKIGSAKKKKIVMARNGTAMPMNESIMIPKSLVFSLESLNFKPTVCFIRISRIDEKAYNAE